jgi:hypothetical protein
LIFPPSVVAVDLMALDYDTALCDDEGDEVLCGFSGTKATIYPQLHPIAVAAAAGNSIMLFSSILMIILSSSK